MTQTSTEAYLRDHEAFGTLPADALAAVLDVSDTITLQPGEDLLSEGDTGRDVFLLIDGEAEAYRAAPDGGTEIMLNRIGPGECLGELAVIDGSPRAASVRATVPVRAVRVDVDRLGETGALAELRGVLAAVAVRRARQLSTAQLQSLQAQLDARVKQTQFGVILLFTIVLLLLSTSLFYLVAEDFVQDVYAPIFSWQAVFLFALPCFGIIFYLKIPLRDLGIKSEGLWRSVWQALALTSAVALPAAIYLIFFKDPIPPEERPVQITAFFLTQYLLHCIFQEIGARGLLQGMFERFLDDTRGHWAVALSSIIFGSMHITFGAAAVVLTFFASLMFGYLYRYQKNLAGVIIFHYGLGVIAAFLVAL